MKSGLRIYEMLLGYACDAKCAFCYNPPLTPAVLAEKISFPRAAGLLARARAGGYDGAWFTGGEPTLRGDLPKFLLTAKKLGFSRIQIGTNGVRLGDARYARRLAKAGLNYARVSLHSHDSARHDRLLALPGAFVGARRGISNLIDAGVYVGLNFVVTSDNHRDLPSFMRFCLDQWNLGDVNVIFLHRRGMMEINAADFELRYSDCASSVREAVRVFRAAREPIGRPTLINVPPCFFPDLEPWIADWSRGRDEADALALPRSEMIDLREMKGRQRVQGPECSSCALQARCLGLEREYAARFGFGELKPVAAAQAT